MWVWCVEGADLVEKVEGEAVQILVGNLDKNILPSINDCWQAT